jgi:hypothetical protein
VLLLIDERRPPDRDRPDRIRLPWGPMPWAATAVAGFVVAATTDGVTGLAGALTALIATFRAFDRALPYHEGLRDHHQ